MIFFFRSIITSVIVQKTRDRRTDRQRYRAHSQKKADRLSRAVAAADVERDRSEQRYETPVEQTHAQGDDQEHDEGLSDRQEHRENADAHKRYLRKRNEIFSISNKNKLRR